MPAIMIGQKTPKEICDDLNKEFKSKKNKLVQIDSKDIDYFIPKVCHTIHQVIYGLIAHLDLIANNKHPLAGWKDFIESNANIFDDFAEFERLLQRIDTPLLEKEITDKFESRKRLMTNINLDQIQGLLNVITELLDANNSVINEISNFLNNPKNSKQTPYQLDWFLKIIAGFEASWEILLVFESFNQENAVYNKFALVLQQIQSKMLNQLHSESDLVKKFYETISDSQPDTSQIASREFLVTLMNLVHKESKSSSKSVEQIIRFLEKDSNPAEILHSFTETFSIRDWDNKCQLLTLIKNEINQLQFTSPNLTLNQRKAVELINKRIVSINIIGNTFINIINIEKKIDNSEATQDLYTEIKHALAKDKKNEKAEDTISDHQQFNQAVINLLDKITPQSTASNIAFS